MGGAILTQIDFNTQSHDYAVAKMKQFRRAAAKRRRLAAARVKSARKDISSQFLVEPTEEDSRLVRVQPQLMSLPFPYLIHGL